MVTTVYKIEIDSLGDICLIGCALQVYYNQVHPSNSCRKDIAKLIKVFSDIRTKGE